MLFRRSPAPAGIADEPIPADLRFDGARSSGLEKALHFVMRRERPEVLDLGPMCGATVVFLAGLGAKVTVTEFDPPATEGEREGRRLTIEQPSNQFDLVLAWEHVDFMPPERLPEFAAELRRVLKADGWLFVLSRARNRGERGHRARFRVLSRSGVAREPLEESPRPRWEHSSRTLERALDGFLIEGIHLRPGQFREVVATRAGFDYSAFSVLGEPLQRDSGLRPEGDRPTSTSVADGDAPDAAEEPRNRWPLGGKSDSSTRFPHRRRPALRAPSAKR